MAMGIRNKAEINVTPMIDVLLVLLIIFMVILPEHSVGLPVQVPPQTDDPGRPLPTRDIVLTVLGGGKVRVDQTDLDIADLPDRLRWLKVRYTAGVAFVKGSNELTFAQVAEVIDVAKGAGWSRIALVPR